MRRASRSEPVDPKAATTSAVPARLRLRRTRPAPDDGSASTSCASSSPTSSSTDRTRVRVDESNRAGLRGPTTVAGAPTAAGGPAADPLPWAARPGGKSGDKLEGKPGDTVRASARAVSAAAVAGPGPPAASASVGEPLGASRRNHTFLPVRSCSVPHAVLSASTSDRPRPSSRRLSMPLSAMDSPVTLPGAAGGSAPAAVATGTGELPGPSMAAERAAAGAWPGWPVIGTAPNARGCRSLTVTTRRPSWCRMSIVASVPACTITLVTSSVTNSSTISTTSAWRRPCNVSIMNRRADLGESMTGGSVRVRRNPSSPSM